MNVLDDLTGKRFGRWTVLYQANNKFKTRMTMWHCRCDCGNEKDIGRSNLVNGKTKSCGCYRKEKSKKLDELRGNMINKEISSKNCVQCAKNLNLYRNSKLATEK